MSGLRLILICCLPLLGFGGPGVLAEPTLSPRLAKPAPITMSELAQKEIQGVAVFEVTDYVFGNYRGNFPSPPHADLNPRRAFVIVWPNFPYRFVFCHEGSYCPWFELRSGAGVCYQFFEGNDGWAELFNNWGRLERNSFVDIIESGPKRVWVRWTYFGVNLVAGQPAYRATEDFWAYPNGLIVRRQTYESLRPADPHGYAREPIELIGLCPAGKRWFDVLQPVSGSAERHALAVLDAFSDQRYDVFWQPKPETTWDSTQRKSGCAWDDLDNTPGVVVAMPMIDGTPFCVFGDASGYHHSFMRLKDHTFVAEVWGSMCWDHWPIGWLNSQGHPVDENSLKLYPNHFSPLGMDFFALPNEAVARGTYYSLYGVAGDDWEAVRTTARQWLEKGETAIANPGSGADLTAVWTPRIIEQQPSDVIIRSGQTARLSILVTNGSFLGYQWQRASRGTAAFKDIAGATGSVYLTESLTDAAPAEKYRCLLSIPGKTITSREATVEVDAVAPVLLSAKVPLGRSNRVMVVFSEPVVVPEGTSHFLIDHGVAVTSVGRDSQSIRLELATSTMTTGKTYTLTVNRIADRVGNEILPDTSRGLDGSPEVPMDYGHVVNGFQDDFNGAVRDPNWVAVPAERDSYQQTNGILRIGTMGGNPNHLLYAAAGYHGAVQEVLARIRVKSLAPGGGAIAGIAVASNAKAIHPGEAVNLVCIRDFSISGPAVRLVDDFRAWGPAVPEFTWENQEWYWLRLRQTASSTVQGPNIYAKAWRADGTEPEPAHWQVDWTGAGRVGWAGIRGPHDSAPTEFEVDYILIKAGGLPAIKVEPSAFASLGGRQ